MKLSSQLLYSLVLLCVYGLEDLTDHYIVVLKHGTDVLAHFNTNQMNSRINSAQIFEPKHIFDKTVLNGYSGRFDPATVDILRLQSEVEYIEADSIMTVSNTQENAPWGLARLSTDHKVEGGNLTYNYDDRAGEGVNVYVLDTGIFLEHVDFNGRAEWGITTDSDNQLVDGNGHGTHVSGTIAGSSYGVSKKAKLIAVKVLNNSGSGSTSGVIKGIEWAANHAKGSGGGEKGNVANMSLGGGLSKALNQAVKSASEHMIFVVAAGNENQDACRVSPASEPSAITVAASTKGDMKASFSNYGKCVDFIAPGKDILSSWIGTEGNGEKIISGTSMASPHVAGIVAYHMSLAETRLGLEEVLEVVLGSAQKDKIEGFGEDTMNLIVNNGFQESH